MTVPYHKIMKYRKQNRLSNYDYSQNGMFFITICTQNKKCYFGEIANDKMILNDFGEIADKLWREIPNHNKNVKLDEFIIMPNHIHGIIEIINVVDGHDRPLHSRSAQTIPLVIGGYKSAVTKTLNQQSPQNTFKWQRSFYDHVIRKNESLNKIREYIMINPQERNKDKYNPTINL